MDFRNDRDFLPLGSTQVASDDESASSPLSSIRPHLDTLFAEFARTRPRLSRSPPARTHRNALFSERQLSVDIANTAATIDLRSLEYVGDCDPHLVCDICHVPFIHPVVLECDHTFCAGCYEQYRAGGPIDERSQCPTCRTYSSMRPKKASRLITNMCNDLRVRCPNEYCTEIMSRGVVEKHVTKECPEEALACPDPACSKTTKRKDFVADTCLHGSHLECECGDLIELGTGAWLKHKDEGCPKSGSKCEDCGERKVHAAGAAGAHVCGQRRQRCPGGEFGCDKRFEPSELDAHATHCPLARLAPYLKKQSQLLVNLQEQLTLSKVRNDVLESGLDKIGEMMASPHRRRLDSSASSVIEEIERIPSPSQNRYEVMLPAHLRPFTPSPDPTSTSQQHLLALHESLRGNVTNLENDVSHLSAGLADLDARTSMQIMNETLRIKEDLAHTNAALFSTRAQVQWLLNRERVGQQMGTRGRASAVGPSVSNAMGSSASQESFDTNLSSQGVGENGTTSSMPNRGSRRLSGGSQERVKL